MSICPMRSCRSCCLTDRVLRVVVDTNVLLSFLMKRQSLPGLLVAQVLEHHNLLLSDSTVQELADKCKRPKFRPYFSESEGQEFMRLLSQAGELTSVNITLTDCRDVKDNQFLELAVAGGADLLVSGDKDLLVLHPYRDIPILTPRDSLMFLEGAHE